MSDAQKLYMFYCEFCNWKQITDGKKLPNELPRTSVQRNVPKYDPETKKIVESEALKLPRKFKCQNCGRGISPKIYFDPTPKQKTFNSITVEYEDRPPTS